MTSGPLGPDQAPAVRPAAGDRRAQITERSPEPPGVAHISALTGLRAVAATWVVLEHLSPVFAALLPATGVVDGWFAGGNLGVEIFFVLSGFILAHNYAARFVSPKRDVTIAFFRARLARLYPVHLCVFVGVGALFVLTTRTGIGGFTPREPYTIQGLISNVLLMQAYPWGQLWTVPSWSITCEATAYLAFPLLAWLALRMRPRSALTAAVALVLLAPIIIVLLAGPEFVSTAGAVIWVRIGFEFPAGVLLWINWRAWSASRTGRAADAVAILAFGLVATILLLVPARSAFMFTTIPLLAVFVIACANSTGPVRRMLCSRPLQWGGRISYSVYMTHAVVLTVIGRWQLLQGAPLVVRVVAIFGYLAAVVLVGAMTYHVVEEPGRRWVNRIGRGRPTRPAPERRSPSTALRPHRGEHSRTRRNGRDDEG